MCDYLILDGNLHGTGIRDYYNGGYLDPQDFNLSKMLLSKLSSWLLRYENEHFNQFLNYHEVEILDTEGLEIARLLKEELQNKKVHYYSAAKLKSVFF